MKKTVLLFFALTVLHTSHAQLAQQDFEGPLSNPWSGNGTLVGSQGSNWNTHGGGGMYELKFNNEIYVSLSLSPVTKYVGLWVNETVFQYNSILVVLQDNSGNLVQNLGTHPAGSSGYWQYKEFQLGAAYTGNYRISFSRSYSNNSVAANATYIDDIIISTTDKLEELSMSDFKLYPNSLQNVFNLVFKTAVDNLTVELVDLAGKTVYSEKEKISLAANETKEIDVRELKAGIYFCKISNGESSFVKKVIIE